MYHKLHEKEKTALRQSWMTLEKRVFGKSKPFSFWSVVTAVRCNKKGPAISKSTTCSADI